MKVILLKDVAKIGRRFEIVDVPDGFALNKLIPKKMAEFATSENLKRINAVASKQKEHQLHDAEAFEKMLTLLQGMHVSVEVEANSEGRMFQALKAEAIVEAIKTVSDITIQKESVVMKVPIKTVGAHTIQLTAGKTQGEIQIIVNSKTK